MKLDGSGNPVVAYYDGSDQRLKVLHCDDPNCADAEAVTEPDASDGAGQYASLALDAAGNPVVSYFDETNGDLKVMHCNDASCAGLDESITSPDTAGVVGRYTSLRLSSLGRPVVSYFDETIAALIRHGEAQCKSAGKRWRFRLVAFGEGQPAPDGGPYKVIQMRHVAKFIIRTIGEHHEVWKDAQFGDPVLDLLHFLDKLGFCWSLQPREEEAAKPEEAKPNSKRKFNPKATHRSFIGGCRKGLASPTPSPPLAPHCTKRCALIANGSPTSTVFPKGAFPPGAALKRDRSIH